MDVLINFGFYFAFTLNFKLLLSGLMGCLFKAEIIPEEPGQVMLPRDGK